MDGWVDGGRERDEAENEVYLRIQNTQRERGVRGEHESWRDWIMLTVVCDLLSRWKPSPARHGRVVHRQA